MGWVLYILQKSIIFAGIIVILSSKSYSFNWDSPKFITNQNQASITAQVKAGDYIMIGINVFAGATVLWNKDFEGARYYALSTLTSGVTTHFLKYSIVRVRPENQDVDSFPSGHASFAFSGAAFLYYRYGAFYGIPAYIAATYVSYSRIAGQKHYITDVIAGAAISILYAKYIVKPYEFSVNDTKISLYMNPPIISRDGFYVNITTRF